MNKIYRSQRDKKLFGLCGGIAEAINVDPTILRLVVVITAVFSSGAVILLYLIASIVIPKEPIFDSSMNYGQPQPYQPQPRQPYQQSYQQQPYQQQPNQAYSHATTSETNRTQEPVKTNIDEMMKDIEKKAMQKEIEELKAKVAKYEKEEQ